MPHLTTVPDPLTVAADALTDEQVRFYKEEGYVILPGLLPPAEADALRAEVLDILSVVGLGVTKLKQTGQYLAGTRLDGLINSEQLREIAGRLMGGPATLYMPFTAVKTGAARDGETGGGEFHYHQDNQYTRLDGPGINLWFALTPMSPENGCLNVVPRSHLDGTLPSHSPDNDGHKAITFAPDSFVPVVMNPGDCVAFSRLTVHGSGPNRTPEHRVAYAVQFHRDDVNYSTDNGQTWVHAKTTPRWRMTPVDRITPPADKQDGH